MNIRRIIIFTWQLPKTRVEFVEIFPASSTSFASRVVGPFQSHVLKVSTNLIYIIQTIFHIFFNILLTLCAVVNELNFRWHWGPVKLLEQVAFTSPATLFQNSTRDVPSMSWYSYKYYHNCIELNELKANTLTNYFHIRVFTEFRSFRASTRARVRSEVHFARGAEVEGREREEAEGREGEEAEGREEGEDILLFCFCFFFWKKLMKKKEKPSFLCGM
jgi:hypothetical protein